MYTLEECPGQQADKKTFIIAAYAVTSIRDTGLVAA